MKTKHTPGPWVNEGEDIVVPEVPCIVISAKNHTNRGDRMICQVASDMDVNTEEFILHDEEWANAHLIAAAPEMFKTLDDVLSVLLDLDQDHLSRREEKEVCDAIQEIEAVLAKAKGEV